MPPVGGGSELPISQAGACGWLCSTVWLPGNPFTASEALGMVLFDNPLVGRQLRRFALLAPMLYVDAVTDANVKGMGQQVACVRYNTVTSFLDVVFLWLLLPRFGLDGYYLSFLVTHAPQFWPQLLPPPEGHRLPAPAVRSTPCPGSCIPQPVGGLLLPKVGGWSGVLFLAAGFCSVFFLLLVLLGWWAGKICAGFVVWSARLTKVGRRVYHN